MKKKIQNNTAETLKILETLKKAGVDLNKIPLTKMKEKNRKILLCEIEQDGIDIKNIIRENDLNPQFRIGVETNNLKLAYYEKKPYKLTKEEKEKMIGLGLAKPKRSETTVTKVLRTLTILKENGVAVDKIIAKPQINGKRRYILLKEIKQDGINIDEIIERNGLNGEECIGMKIMYLGQAVKGTNRYKMSDNERKKLEELGLLKNLLKKDLKIFRLLSESGIDLSKLNLQKAVNGKGKYILLKDIQQEGIDIDEIIKKNKLDENLNIGMKIRKIRDKYNQNAVSEEERKEIEKLGLVKIKKESSVEEVLRILKILDANGVDVSKIQVTTKSDEKRRYILLKEIEQEGVDINKIIEENGLDGNFHIGIRIMQLKQAYKGNSRCLITDAEREEVKKLGLANNLIRRERNKKDAISRNKEAKELYEKYKDLCKEDGKSINK